MLGRLETQIEKEIPFFFLHINHHPPNLLVVPAMTSSYSCVWYVPTSNFEESKIYKDRYLATLASAARSTLMHIHSLLLALRPSRA